MKTIFCLFIIVLCSCSQSDHYGLGEFDTINTSDAIKAMFKNCALDQKKQGASAKLKYLSYALESFSILPGQNSVIGSDSLKKILDNRDKQNTIIDHTISDIHVFPINSITATYHYETLTTYSDSTKTQKQLKQLESGVVIKVENQWLYLNSQSQVVE